VDSEDFGLRLTKLGILLLLASLILTRVAPAIAYNPIEGWLEAGALWTVWAAGMLAVMIGVARIFVVN